MFDRRTQERERRWVLVRGGRAQGAVQTHTKQTDTPRELVVLHLLDAATRPQRRLADEKACRQLSRGIPQQNLAAVIRHESGPSGGSPSRISGTARPGRRAPDNVGFGCGLSRPASSGRGR